MSEKILILDDDKDILDILDLILTESGYEILSLTHGDRVFEEIEVFEPNLILMDIRLGDLDGLSICENLKKNMQYGHVPVIIISANEDLERSLDKAGAPNDYLAKPFDIDLLLSKVEMHLRA